MRQAKEARQLTACGRMGLLDRDKLRQEFNKRIAEAQILYIESGIAQRALGGYFSLVHRLQTSNPDFPIGIVVETLRSHGYSCSFNCTESNRKYSYSITIDWAE